MVVPELNNNMTDNFDNFVNEILEEKYQKCTAPTSTQLSNKSQYRFTKCVEAPYSDGIKRIFFARRGQPLSSDRCANNPTPGTAKYEECKLYLKAVKKKIAKRKRKSNK